MLFKRTNFYQKKSRDTNKKDIFIQGHVIFEQTQRLKAKNKRFYFVLLSACTIFAEIYKTHII